MGEFPTNLGVKPRFGCRWRLADARSRRRFEKARKNRGDLVGVWLLGKRRERERKKILERELREGRIHEVIFVEHNVIPYTAFGNL